MSRLPLRVASAALLLASCGPSATPPTIAPTIEPAALRAASPPAASAAVEPAAAAPSAVPTADAAAVEAPRGPAVASSREEESAAAAATAAKSAKMASLPGGTFWMGERGDVVKVAPFSLDVTEVTADAYAACVNAGACSIAELGCGDAPTYGVAGKGHHPINCVDWNQAHAYCQWAGKRLPTEAEWEWASRGQAAGTKFPWGNHEPGARVCWRRSGTCEVGTHLEGDAPGGIHDLTGNVWEWTSTSYDAATRVDRGGGWSNTVAKTVRAASRGRRGPGSHYDVLGLRCAR